MLAFDDNAQDPGLGIDNDDEFGNFESAPAPGWAQSNITNPSIPIGNWTQPGFTNPQPSTASWTQSAVVPQGISNIEFSPTQKFNG